MRISALLPLCSGRMLALVSVACLAGWISACTRIAHHNTVSMQSAWTNISDAAGDFSVLMPMKPREVVKAHPSDGGPVIMSHEFIVDPDRTIELGVIYNDYPESLPYISALGSPWFFDTVQDEVLKRLGEGRLISSRNGVFASHPMREVRFQVPEKKLMYKTRMIVVGHRMYQLIVVSSEGVNASHEVDILFNSFLLLSGESR
jgi:hypothetical protein